MERLRIWLDAISFGAPDWDLILRFLDVLIWPTVVLLGMIMIRPWRLIDALLENGGEVSAAGAAIKLSKRIGEVSESIRTDEEIPLPAEVPANPLGEDADPYATIMNGWGLVVMGLEEALERTKLDPLDGRRPMEAVRRLRQGNHIGNKLERNIQKLWDVRNRVKSAGSNRLRHLGLTREVADEYYESACRVKKGIHNALNYRERRAQMPNGGVHHQPPGTDEPDLQLVN